RRLGGLVKDNTGYDLAQLLCGSEGTLGIVTAARLRLVPRPRHVVTALAGVASIEAAVALAAELRWALPEVLALEMMTGPSLRLVAEHLGAPPPVAPGAGAYLLVEAGGAEDPLPHLAAALDGRARRLLPRGRRAGRRRPAGRPHAAVRPRRRRQRARQRRRAGGRRRGGRRPRAGAGRRARRVDQRRARHRHAEAPLARAGPLAGRGGRHAGGEAGARPRRRAEPPRRAARGRPGAGQRTWSRIGWASS